MTERADERYTPVAALEGSLKDFRAPRGPDMIDRVRAFYDWQDLRRRHDLWPYARSTASAPLSNCRAKSDAGKVFSGINFASQDYLGLSSHPAIKRAATEAIEAYGVHSAGSAALLGNTANSLGLEHALSDFLNGRDIVLYPTGWAAGYGAIQGFVRPYDHVVMDILAHSCLQEGAKAATQNIRHFAHLSTNSLRRRLAAIRAQDKDNGILVVTESLFSMHSHIPDLKAISELSKEYDATLLVDCAHDFGAMGEDGLGGIGQSGILDDIDIVIASFSKTFASNGGFVAVKGESPAEYLKYYSATHTFSNALSPSQAAVVKTALDIIRSEEGARLRRDLLDSILYLRSQMEAAGAEALGEPSPIVPIRVGGEALGRLVARQLPHMGGIANLVEYPAVHRGDSRFRFQVMATHTRDDIDKAVKALAAAMAAGRAELRRRSPADMPSSFADSEDYFPDSLETGT